MVSLEESMNWTADSFKGAFGPIASSIWLGGDGKWRWEVYQRMTTQSMGDDYNLLLKDGLSKTLSAAMATCERSVRAQAKKLGFNPPKGG